jgi:hypothetical protein
VSGRGWGGQFGAEGEQGCGAVLLGSNADLVQPQTDLAVAETTPPGCPPGKSQGASSGVPPQELQAVLSVREITRSGGRRPKFEDPAYLTGEPKYTPQSFIDGIDPVFWQGLNRR